MTESLFDLSLVRIVVVAEDETTAFADDVHTVDDDHGASTSKVEWKKSQKTIIKIKMRILQKLGPTKLENDFEAKFEMILKNWPGNGWKVWKQLIRSFGDNFRWIQSILINMKRQSRSNGLQAN